MKKAVLLMVLILMAIFIFSPQVQAQEAPGIDWEYFYPVPPHAVPNDGTGSATFEWVITLPGPADYSYTYYFNIFHGEMDVIISKEYRVEKGTVSPVVDKYIYNVREGLPVGTYTAKISHPYPKDYETELKQNFKVGAGNLKILKFNDSNRDGKQDDGELGLAGWIFTITPQKSHSFDVTTGADGTYTVPNLMLGEYTITEHRKDGWNSTTPISQKAKVEEHQKTYVTFGNYEVGTLEIIKFNDTNQNGKVDDGVDERLRGWEFNVTDPEGKTTKYTTDNNGEIKIEVPLGNYIIEEILKGDWRAITSTKQTRKAVKGETTTVQFLNTLPPGILIQKFDDTNRNDKIDNADERLPNWEFKVTDPDGKTTTHVTDDKGEIWIEVPREYEGNEYIIEEILPPHWEAVLPIKQTVKGETTTVQFLNTLPPEILIQKFNDTNRNGKIDNTDERLPNWEFKVTDPDGKATTHVTDDRGEIIIEIPREYERKDYIIEETVPPKWVSVFPIKQTVKGETTTVQFLNTLPPEILIQKFDDTNRNDKIDNADERLPNWEFKVTDPDGKATTHVTDDKGEIIIEVPPKYVGNEYTIEETLQPGWKALSLIKQTAKGETRTVKFLNMLPQGNLSIIKFYDPNQNRVQDPGDQGLAWNFSIMFPDGSVKRNRTDENGSYLRRNIPVGEYEITEEPRGCRWTNSTDMTQKVEVKGGQETIAQFRNYIAECCILPGCVWKNSDENIEVCKSVDPCSVAIGKEEEEEEEVTVHLGLCVDPKHIINGTKVENISVIDTLHSQFTIVNGSFSKEPKYDPIKNPDGTTTIRWDISSLCCEEWNVSFNVTVAFALPIDVTDTSERITSKVIYEDPIETGRQELSIPEGKLKFSFIAPIPPICYVLGGLLVLSISIEITLKLKRRKKEKSKEKEKE